MSSFDARPTGQPDTWVIRRDGIEVALLSFIPGAVTHPQLHVDAAVAAWNHPPRPELFAGPAGTMLAARRDACTHPRAQRVYSPHTNAETCGRCGREVAT